MKYLIVAIYGLLICNAAYAQTEPVYKSWNPATNEFAVIEGQAWPGEVKDPYDRFPARAEKTVDKDVWDLSKNSAGLFIRFTTNATKLQVKYQVKGKLAFPHMPATGVSGTDLYAIGKNGKWFWCPGRYSFGDTITYTFSNLLSRDDSSKSFEYRLYLPLYNTISSMDIQVAEDKAFRPLPLRTAKPVVVYGTSIAQGGCAGRTGLAWTAILERNLNMPLINLGFSGMGHLDKAVIDLITEIDAAIYILDCLPNLVVQSQYPDADVTSRILSSVKSIREKRLNTPIILSEHSAGGSASGINHPKDNVYAHVNDLLKAAIAKLKSEGVKNIYLLTNKEIHFNMYSTVDGTHPNDLGMEQNAAAFEKLIRRIPVK